MEPVLPGFRLGHLLKPDRRTQPGRVEKPVVEGRLLPKPGAVVRVPGRGWLGRWYRPIAQRLRPESRQHNGVFRVDGQLPEHHAQTLDPAADTWCPARKTITAWAERAVLRLAAGPPAKVRKTVGAIGRRGPIIACRDPAHPRRGYVRLLA